MKKIAALFAVVFTLSALVFAQASSDPKDPFYSLVERWETKRLISEQPPLRPYPLKLIDEILSEVIECDDEEEAAAMMGASGFQIWRKITLPHMKWALIYGMILCAARALGEFGAVNALSKTRGKTFTLPLEIDALYLSGSSDSITSAFAVSSILVIIAVAVLILREVMELREKRR